MEDVIIWFCVAVVLVVMLYFITGCSARHGTKIDVIWHDGQCLLIVNGINVDEAAKTLEEWQLRECEIELGKQRSGYFNPEGDTQ